MILIYMESIIKIIMSTLIKLEKCKKKLTWRIYKKNLQKKILVFMVRNCLNLLKIYKKIISPIG